MYLYIIILILFTHESLKLIFELDNTMNIIWSSKIGLRLMFKLDNTINIIYSSKNSKVVKTFELILIERYYQSLR